MLTDTPVEKTTHTEREREEDERISVKSDG
jgi:hypothetical protein